MKKNEYLKFNFLTQKSLFRSVDFIEIVKEQLRCVPHYIPDEWSLTDDKKFHFDRDNLKVTSKNNLIPGFFYFYVPFSFL